MGDFFTNRASYLYDVSQIALAHEQGNHEAVQHWKPDSIDNSDMKIIQHGSSTAVIVHDKSANEIIVSYDGSLEDFVDYVDDIHVMPTNHSNDGSVRSGYMNSIMRENDEGRYLIDEIKETIQDMSKNAESPVDLSFTGFSKGGAMAELTASVWLSERFPEPSDNLKMKEIYTFGSPPLGDGEFVKNFEADMEREGISKFRVDLGKDSVPSYTMGVMEQAGDRILLIPDKDTGKTTAVLNPDEKFEDQLMDNMEDRSDWHNVNDYKTAIDQIKEPLQNDPSAQPTPPNTTPDLPSIKSNTFSPIA